MFKRGKIQISDHFNGKKFFNPGGASDHSFKDFIKIAKEIQRAPWPKWVDLDLFPKPKDRVVEGLEYSIVNHSTILIQTEGLNILTDPVYAERVSPVTFAGPKRVHRPGIAFNDLPAIDVVLVSHNHYDHLDIKTLIQLEKKFKPLFLTSLGNEKLLRKNGLSQVEEFDWWETSTVAVANNKSNLRIHFVPAQHFSSRGLHDRNRTLWGGFVIESKTEKIYFGGDTGYGTFFKEVSERLGAMTLSFIPIGAYEPRWFMKPVHMNPEDAVLAHVDLKSKKSVGIHFGCFKLTSEAIHDPIEHLKQGCQKYGVSSDDFYAPEFGRVYRL